MSILAAKRGFTLVELLVALSIIAVLSSILYASFDSGRDSSRTKALKSELKEIQLALELYKSQNGSYPEPTTSCDSGMLVVVATASGCSPLPYIETLIPEYTTALPKTDDSPNPNCEISYTTDSAQTWYKLTAEECIGGDENLTVESPMARCPDSCSATVCAGSTMNSSYLSSEVYTKSFAVYSQGGECQ